MTLAIRTPRLSGLIEVTAWLVLLALFLGSFGKTAWVLDLCSHFRAQYAATLVICVTILLFAGQRRKALLFAVPTLGVILTLVPLPGWKPAPTRDGARFKLISFNVNTANERHRDVLDYLLREDADIVFLMEVDDEWINDLRELDKRYPAHLKSPSPDNFGLAVYSRQPFTAAGSAEFGEQCLPVADIHTMILGLPSRFIGVHTLPPSSGEQTELRNEELFHYADITARSDLPVVIAGDFNLTPYSSWFSAILKRSGLRDSAAGLGYPPTWMRSVPFFAIPIDQAWISRHFTVVAREIGPSLGSDHSAVVLTLGLAPP